MVDITSGIYPYEYQFPYPFRIPSPNGNLSGIVNRVDPASLVEHQTLIAISGIHLCQAWFSLITEYRKHKRFDDPINGTAYVNVVDGIQRDFFEPDPSGFTFTAEASTPEFNFAEVNRLRPAVARSGITQIHVPNYIEDLRVGLDLLYAEISSEYDVPDVDLTIDASGNVYPWNKGFVRGDFVRSLFLDTPSGSIGLYSFPVGVLPSGALYAVSWAEVFYNPYPRIASKEAINVANNIRDLRFETGLTVIERERIYARLDQYGPIFPMCQTPDGTFLAPNTTNINSVPFNDSYTIGFSGYVHQKNTNTVRVDGHILLPDLVELRVLDDVNLDPTTTEGRAHIDDGQYAVLGRSSVISQSGAREFGRTIDRRPPNAGNNIIRFPATTFGFPSASGEPVGLVAGGLHVPSGILSPDKSTRAWFDMPVLGADSEDVAFTITAPRFGEVGNVKRIAVMAKSAIAGELDASGVFRNGIAQSGLLSIWPSPGAYMSGSGQGYHIMDRGLWVRHSQVSLGMTLFSPYNGSRMMFRFADTNNRTIEDTIRTFGNTISFDIDAENIDENPITAQSIYGVSWGGSTGRSAATAWGCHSNGFYHIFGTQTSVPDNATTQIPIDDATSAGSDLVQNGTLNLVSDFSTGIGDPIDTGFSTIINFNERKAHGLWSVPELEVLGIGKASLNGSAVTVQATTVPVALRSINVSIFNIVASIGQSAPAPVPVGFAVQTYFTSFSWSPGRGISERTTGGTMVGLGTQAASTPGILNGGGWPALTRQDLWNLANSTGSDGSPAFGTGTSIRTGTHPSSTGVVFGGSVDPQIIYVGADTKVMTFAVGSVAPTVTVQAVLSPSVPGVVQGSFILRTAAGSIGSVIVSPIISDFDGLNLNVSERQVTDVTYMDSDIIAISRGNNRFSTFADKMSIAPITVAAGGVALEESRISTQDIDPGAEYNYVGELLFIDENFWPQITASDIV